MELAPHVETLLAEFPTLRARAVGVELRLRQRLHEAQAANHGFGGQPLVIRSIIDLVEGRTLRIDPALSKVLGVCERELIESSFLDRVHPDDRLPTLREMELVAAGKRAEGLRIRHRHASGAYLEFEWAAVADADGELCYTVAVVKTQGSPGACRSKSGDH